ncbi:prolyl 4-hydroxylase subunit alpha-1 [Argonauta hians]
MKMLKWISGSTLCLQVLYLYQTLFLIGKVEVVMGTEVEKGVFSSVYKIQELLKEERKMLTHLQNFIDSQHLDNVTVNTDIISFLNATQSQNNAASNAPNYAENPVNSYRLLHRIYATWKSIIETFHCEDCMHNNNTKKFIKEFETVEKWLWPTEEDVREAALGLFRLQDIYRLNLTELLQGRIADTQTQPLTAKDVITLVKIANEQDLVFEEISWLLALEHLYDKSKIDMESVEHDKIYKLLSSAYSVYGMPWLSLVYIEKCLKLKPDDKRCQREKTYLEKKLMNIPKNKRLKVLEKNESQQKRQYGSLCRGDKVLSNTYRASLRCSWRPTKNPYSRVKEEVVSVRPKIVLFHDVITESESRHVLEESQRKFFSSKIKDEDIIRGIKRDSVSQSAWLWDSDPVLRRLSRRIESITGMNSQLKIFNSNAEPLQVLNYGLGGITKPHVDYLQSKELTNISVSEFLVGSGDRIATWMFHMSNVTLGGATVFPKINVQVPVIKGSALFWYNLKRNQQPDPRTLHASCPVALGSKWVSNKWIHQVGQMFRYSCGLKVTAEHI